MTRYIHKLILVCALAMPSYAQIFLTGAINFSTNSSGAAYDGQVWNTLGTDSYWDLWLARNADATLKLNGPADDQASISIPLSVGQTYKFYIFGQPGDSTGFNGLNLFFNSNDGTPGISVFGATGGSLFAANASTTYTLEGGQVPGSGRTFFSSGGATVFLTEYEWNAPVATSPDVCQAHLFEPGEGPDFYGSFTLHVSPAASLIVTPGTGAPGTGIIIAGSGFAPLETVNIYLGEFGLIPRYTATADAFGAFTLPAVEAQAPYGYAQYFAIGLTSGDVGTAVAFVSPALAFYPSAGVRGSTTNAQGVGFGAGETVQVYWNSPRQLLGTVVANSLGSFVNTNGLTITVPINAPLGLNGVIGVGETTKAIGLGSFTVE